MRIDEDITNNALVRHFYSAAAGGFYRSDIHTRIPADAVEITANHHTALLEALAAGKRIQTNAAGDPVAAEPAAPTTEQLAQRARNQRDALLHQSDSRALPDFPLIDSERLAWTAYRQALRDITTQPGFPDTITWPVPPT